METKKIETKQTHLTIGELAHRWGLSPTFIRRAIWSGKLRITRFGRAIRISIEDADRFAEGHSAFEFNAKQTERENRKNGKFEI
jgi:excisionase family DNA binding protein